jgi:Snf7
LIVAITPTPHLPCKQSCQDESHLWFAKAEGPKTDSQRCHNKCISGSSKVVRKANTHKTDGRIAAVDDKIKKLDRELTTYRDRMSKMRDGPGKTTLKQRAMKVLQQRKMYEGQRDQLQSSSWSMEQAAMTTDNLRNVMTTVDAMKSANKEMRRRYGKVDVNKIER